MENDGIRFGFWNYLHNGDIDLSVVREWKKMGCNLPMTFIYDDSQGEEGKRYMLSLLDECERLGMKALVFDWRTNFRHLQDVGKEEFAKDVRASVRDFGSHPAVFGFMVGDEPALDSKDEEDFIFTCRLLNEFLPGKHHFGNLLPYFQNVNVKDPGAEARKEYLKNAIRRLMRESGSTLLAYDDYTQCLQEGEDQREGLRAYFYGMGNYMDLSRELGLPLYVSLLSVGHYRYRVPSEADIRFQMNSALMMGARGVIWFYFHQVANDPGFMGWSAPFFGKSAKRTPMADRIERQQTFFNDYWKKDFDDIAIDAHYFLGDIMEEKRKFPGHLLGVLQIDLRKDFLTLVSIGHRKSDGKPVMLLMNGSTECGNFYTVKFEDGSHIDPWLSPGEMRFIIK